MNTASVFSSVPAALRSRLAAAWPAVLVAFISMPGALAQTAIAPSATDVEYQRPGERQSPLRSRANRTPPPLPAFLQWGPVTVHPGLSYQFVDATGIPSHPGRVADTTIQTLSPNLVTAIGAHWTVAYHPAWTFYSSDEFTNTVDHAATLTGETKNEAWTLGFFQNYSRTFQPLIETGRQTRVERHDTDFNISYRIDSRFSLETAANQNLNYTTDFNDFKEWKLVEWLHLQFSPHLDMALGVGPGYVEVNNASDSNYYQFLGRIDWHPGDRLEISLEAGVDHRKLRTRNAGYENNPTINASTRYQIFEHTMLSVEAARTVSVPYFADQILKTNRWTVSLEQRLLGRYHLNLSAGQQKSSYRSNGASGPADRDDRNRWYDLRLSTAVLQRGTIAIFFHKNKNASTEPGYGFSSDQTGGEMTYRY